MDIIFALPFCARFSAKIAAQECLVRGRLFPFQKQNQYVVPEFLFGAGFAWT